MKRRYVSVIVENTPNGFKTKIQCEIDAMENTEHLISDVKIVPLENPDAYAALVMFEVDERKTQ